MANKESYTEIQRTLREGIVIDFPSFSINVIPACSTAILQEIASMSRVEQQDFLFFASTKDCANNNIAANDTFTTTDDDYLFNWIVQRDPTQYTDGWSKLPIMLVERIKL